MASNGYLPTLVFLPEQGLNRVPKDSQHLLPIHGLRDDSIRSSSLNMGPQQNVGPWKPISELFENKQFGMIDQIITKPALIDIQDSCPNLTLFNVKPPTPDLIEVEKDRLDLLSLSDLTGLQTMKTDHKPYLPDIVHMDSQLIYQNPEFDSRKPFIDFVGDLVRHSEITVDEDGQVSLSGTRTDVKDILSILAEFYLSKTSTNWRKSLVPQFNRLDYDETSYYGSALALENMIIAPPKSPEKVKPKSTTKKKGARYKTKIQHRSDNYIQACESLLSIIVDKTQNRKSAIPMLKKSGPELPNLLTQFSASIAGTGIAVLFSVACKVASGRVPFCSSKLLNTGLGLGLVWLSWAVNRLRDTVVMISRNSNKKKGLKDAEMMKKLDRNVKEIYFRAAALMAVVVLRLA